jgi:CubicO group peptidase (beta-lactamase class C family)
MICGAAPAAARMAPPIDTPVVDAFPDYADLAADPARRAITARGLLSMTSGLAWRWLGVASGDDSNDENAMRVAADSLRHAVDPPIVLLLGEVCDHSGDATAMLCAVIARGTGRDLHDYFREKLFDPLGAGCSEWARDHLEALRAFAGLRLTPRAAAGIGQLVVKEGARGRGAGRAGRLGRDLDGPSGAGRSIRLRIRLPVVAIPKRRGGADRRRHRPGRAGAADPAHPRTW